MLAEVDSTGAITRTYMWGALGLISDHTSAGGSHISRTSDDLLPNRFESLPGRHGARDRLALCQAGGSDRYYLYDAQGNTSTLVDGGGNASGQGEYTPYGGTVGTELNTPYAWQGQYGNYHEREPGLYIMQTPSAPPYVPAAPTYTSPQSFSSPNPYQPMNANPASYGPQDDDDGHDVGYASSGLDAIRRGGGGPKGRQMWRDFMNHTVNSIPFGGCLMALSGQDMIGCKMDMSGRIGNMTQGLLSGAPAAGHFGALIGGAPVAGIAAVQAAEGEAAKPITTLIGRNADVDKWLAKFGTGEENLHRPGMENWTWRGNLEWLKAAVDRGDRIICASDPWTLSPERVKGVPNGHFTYRELEWLKRWGSRVTAGWQHIGE